MPTDDIHYEKNVDGLNHDGLTYNGKTVNSVGAERAIKLKQRIDAELMRRDGYGSDYSKDDSLKAYIRDSVYPENNHVSEEWSYNDGDRPSMYDRIQEISGRKLIQPLLAIADVGDLMFTNVGEAIPDDFQYKKITEFLDKIEAEPMHPAPGQDPTVTCRGACTGLCVGTCIHNCDGCSDQCTNVCQGCGACTSGCTGCGGNCVGHCKDECSGTCGAGCQDICFSACGSGCWFECEAECGVSCDDACAGTCNYQAGGLASQSLKTIEKNAQKGKYAEYGGCNIACAAECANGCTKVCTGCKSNCKTGCGSNCTGGSSKKGTSKENGKGEGSTDTSSRIYDTTSSYTDRRY